MISVRKNRGLPEEEEAKIPWACVFTYGRQEEYAVEQLSNQEYRAFCPVLRYPDPKNPREMLSKPLFPCYAFVRIALEQKWSSINNTRGVIRLLTTTAAKGRDGYPLFLPEGQIEQWYDPSEEQYALDPGTHIKVRNKNSPFYELEGTVREMTKAQRVYVLLSMFNRDIEVRFDHPDELENLDKEKLEKH